MRRTVSALFASAIAFGALPALAERPSTIDSTRTDEMNLSYRFQRGQSALYTLTGHVDMEGLEGDTDLRATLDLSMPIRHEVQTVSSEGVGTVAISLDPPTLTMDINGEDEGSALAQRAFRGTRLTLGVRPDGSIAEHTGTISPEGTALNTSDFVSDLLALGWVQFPSEPVRIGDTWLQTIPMAMGAAAQTLQANLIARYTLAGFALVNGREQVVIDVTYSTEINGTMQVGEGGLRVLRVVGRGRGDGYVLFDFQTGSVTEVALDQGVILTQTEANGDRFSQSLSSRATLTRTN